MRKGAFDFTRGGRAMSVPALVSLLATYGGLPVRGAASAVLQALAAFGGASGSDSSYRAAVAARAGVSTRSVSRALVVLRALGLVSVVQTKRGFRFVLNREALQAAAARLDGLRCAARASHVSIRKARPAISRAVRLVFGFKGCQVGKPLTDPKILEGQQAVFTAVLPPVGPSVGISDGLSALDRAISFGLKARGLS